MPRIDKLLRLALTALAIGFCGCGSVPAPPPVVSPSTLAGNWLLFGTLPSTYPTLTPAPGSAITVNVVGETLTVAASFKISCDAGSPDAGDFLIFNSGDPLVTTAAADGTFAITTSGNANNGLYIQGTVPPSAGQPWNGTFSFTSADFSCPVHQKLSFTAVPIAQVAGTYSATGSFPYSSGAGIAAGSPVTFDFTAQQGATLYQPDSSTPNTLLALSGSLRITGFSCFTSGTIGTVLDQETFGSAISGSEFYAFFTMDDGASVQLYGNVASTDASQLDLSYMFVDNGPCVGTYNFGYTPLILHK